MRTILIPFIVVALLLAGCGGSDGGDTTSAAEDRGDEREQSSDAEGGDDEAAAGDSADAGDGEATTGAAPLTGAVAFSFSTPLAVDAATGTATPLGPPLARFSPTAFARADDAAYAVMQVGDPDNFDLATDYLVRIDAATGELTTLTTLQELDSSTGAPIDTYGPILPVDGAVGVVTRGADAKTIETFDAATGELVTSIPADEFGTVVTDGVGYVSTIYGGLVRLDPATGAREELIAEGTAFRDAAPDADLVAATETEDGSPLSAENADALETVVSLVEVDLGNAVLDDSGVWWINERAGISFQDGTQAIHEALAFYDFAAGQITTYVPTGEFGARFLPEDANFDVSTLQQAEMVVVDGTVFVNDQPVRDDGENGRILAIDPATGSVEVRYEPDLAGADYHTLELLDTAPDGLWVVVKRYTITEENADGSRSSTFETQVVQLDPASGAELAVVALQ